MSEKCLCEPDEVILLPCSGGSNCGQLCEYSRHQINAGGRDTFSTGVLQATCVDGTILPFLSGEVNMSFGCYGCREATDMQDDEAIIGIPAGKLQGIVASLSKLAEKAMPRVRAKKVYQMYMERLGYNCFKRGRL